MFWHPLHPTLIIAGLVLPARLVFTGRKRGDGR